jgi:hypothetical protein
VTLADGAGGARFEFTGVDVVDADRAFQSATVD